MPPAPESVPSDESNSQDDDEEEDLTGSRFYAARTRLKRKRGEMDEGVCVCLYIYICIYIYIYICTYVCMYVCMHVCV
jgi:hypothetical protein